MKDLYDGTYETDITYECPVRGTVTQRVEIKKYKSPHEYLFHHNVCMHSSVLEATVGQQVLVAEAHLNGAFDDKD